METIDLVPMIDLLDDSVDDLEEALEPLLKCALSETAGKLPMLDRAQLYVLVAYAIESILFSYFRLNGVNSKDHPVFRELTRVKQYFEKIKAAESAGTKQAVKLNKAAAGRFIKHALAENKRYDHDMGKQGGIESTATHTRLEEGSQNQISNDPGNGSRAVFRSNEPLSDLEHLESHDRPSLKRKKWQSLYDIRESEDGVRSGTKHETNPSSEKASKTDQKQTLSKKPKMLEENRGASNRN